MFYLPLVRCGVWKSTAMEETLIGLFHPVTAGILKGVERPKLFDRCVALLRPRNTLPAGLPVSAFQIRHKSILQREALPAGQYPSATCPRAYLSGCTTVQNAYSSMFRLPNSRP